MPSSGIAATCGHSVFNVLRKTALLFSMVAMPSSTSTSNVQEFQFLCLLAIFSLFFFFLIIASPGGYEMTSHCGFDLHLLENKTQ